MYNFIEIALRHGCSPVNLLHIFRTPFPKNTFGWLLLDLPLYRHLFLLVGLKRYPLQRKTGLCKRKLQRCLTCKNFKECNTISSFVTKESLKFNHHFDCNNKCLIYLILCKVYVVKDM